MATDYLSALNVGSGLNTTEIIDSLVNAERAPRENIINTAKEDKTVSISALGQVKTNLSGLNTNLDIVKSINGLKAVQSGSSVSVEVIDSNLATAFTHQIEVQGLASSQTLVFDGFTGRDQSLGAGSLTISFGAWDADTGIFTANTDQEEQIITIADGQDSLANIRDAINDANIGATASVIDTGDDNFNLMLRSETGENNALRVVATETTAGSGLAGLDFSSYVSDQEVVSASDAAFTIDGVSITRTTNTIEDAFEGISITLANTTSTSETIGAEWDSDIALTAMEALVTNINSFSQTLADLSKRGINGGEDGPLAGDPLVRSIQNRMRSLTTEPIEGYGDEAVYLATFGMQTERDGSITLDEDVFTAAFKNDPSSFNAIIKNSISTSNVGIDASVIGDDWTSGVYELVIDGDGNATIDDAEMSLLAGTYRTSEGATNGLRLDVSANVTESTIYMGRSLVSKLQSFASALLENNNDIDIVIDRYNDDISTYDDKLDTLDNRMTSLRERYVSQFTAMQSLVASLDNTKEGLDNMMDAWRGSMNN